ncbi:GGDEF domain-containing phosphodiesterase [Paenibacillus endoradicis]|uniref:GGDEF domain-containing phosphodiesterase n=1 Tax=Paenibacillus endoradicis TaxID=2972487 RepID=UPI002158CE38|nr:GGDEF domain-containing phosphodiesterase [Paenibacillus endoradicis]MCR8660003.1 GGDEF domain-containing phosphodiesterase [Paenibacillus endoradicis]
MLMITVEWESMFANISGDQLITYNKLEKQLWQLIVHQFPTEGNMEWAAVERLRAGYYRIKYYTPQHLEPIERILLKIKNNIEQQIQIDGERYYIHIYMGVYQYDYDSQNRIEITRSEIALKFAKTDGNHRVFIYEHEMIVQLERKLLVEGLMREAINDEHFTLDFQPIYQLQAKQLIGFEALLRWEHSIYGKVSPLEFIAVAEKSGLINPLGAWVIEEACKEMSRISSYLPNNILKIYINLSPLQLYNQDIVDNACRCSDKYGISHHLIQFELTECTFSLVDKRIINTINDLQQAGFIIAIDDFGVGYSTLESLSILPIQCVKLDQSFVKHMEHDEKHYAIVKNILLLSNEIKVDLIAEGVESMAQQQLLEDLGCLLAQGNFFSKPIPSHMIDQNKLRDLLSAI